MLHGYDISAYQSTTAPAGDFVIVKATEGKSYTSSHFAAQWKSAKTKAKHRGAYHFAHPEQSSAASQAARFLDLVQPAPGESVWLDLEVSGLSQAKTNAWARAWGDYMAEHVPGVTSGVYLGSGYASNGTGRGLSEHFSRWWYPQYPGAYQLRPGVDVEAVRAANRSHLMPGRRLIASMTTKWPPAVSPWLPASNTTGWKLPDIWQFTDHWGSAQLDASVTALTLDQLAGGGQNTSTEDTMPYGGQLQPGAGTRANISFPKGSMGAIGLVYDSPDVAEVRVALHHKGGGGEVYTLKVGGPDGENSWPAKTVQKFKTPADGDWVSLTRLDDGKDPVGWDMS